MSMQMLSLVFGAESFGAAGNECSRRLVMLALADRVNDNDVDFCYPGMEDIAARTSRGVSTVRRVIGRLKTEGWLTVTARSGYGNVYRLNVTKLEASQRPTRERPKFLRVNPHDAAPSQVSGLSVVPRSSEHTTPLISDILNRKNPKESNSSSRRSRAAKATSSADPRHIPCRSAVERALTARGLPFSWGPAEANQLGSLLRHTPRLTEALFSRLLEHLAASDDGAILKRPCKWLPDLARYSQGPLDRFGCPKNGATYQPQIKSAIERYRESD